jgi:hypothetical protein
MLRMEEPACRKTAGSLLRTLAHGNAPLHLQAALAASGTARNVIVAGAIVNAPADA